MKTTYILATGLSLVLATSASALHYVNCSDYDGNLRIVEKEIWGANPVGCYYEGDTLTDATVTLDQSSRKTFEKKGSGRDTTEYYVLKASVAFDDDDKKPVQTVLLCKEVTTSALDLAPGRKPCKIVNKGKVEEKTKE